MAKRRRTHQDQGGEFPGWVWMLFGLAIGLGVAFTVYLNSRAPLPAPAAAGPAPAAATAPAPSALDDNGETAGPANAPDGESRFDFYSMLPNFEVVIHEEEPDVRRDVAPRAVEAPGLYVLQAGSFSAYEDADRRRAELALQGIESSIQRVAVEDKTYHRVRIGPTRDLDLLNEQRARLRQVNIDVLRIRLGD